MSQNGKSEMAEEDYKLIEQYELGSYLAMYEISAQYICLIRILSMFLGAACIFVAAMWILIIGQPGWPLSLFIDSFGGLVILGGIGIGLLALPNTYKGRLTVCEAGIIRRTQLLRYRDMQIIYWKNMRIARSALNFIIKDYLVQYRKNEARRNNRSGAFGISSVVYQNGNELIALIEEQLTNVERNG